MNVFKRTDSKTHPAILTPWSLVHFAAGAASKNYMSLFKAEFAHLVYEIVGSKRIFNMLGFNIKKESSFVNSVGDQAIFTLGRAVHKSEIWTWVTVAVALLYTVLGIEF